MYNDNFKVFKHLAKMDAKIKITCDQIRIYTKKVVAPFLTFRKIFMDLIITIKVKSWSNTIIIIHLKFGKHFVQFIQFSVLFIPLYNQLKQLARMFVKSVIRIILICKVKKK